MTASVLDTALITGGAGGIGRALAARLRARGVRVAITSRDAARAAEVDADLHLAVDATTPEGIAQALAACREAWGEAPARVAHCVGSTLIAPLHRSQPAQAREVLRVNLESAVHLLAAWVEARRTVPGGGAAVLMSSVVAGIGVSNHEVIAAAKAGVEGLARSVAATYAPQSLRFNVVAPGLTETALSAGLTRQPEMRAAAARQYPLPHAEGVQTADDVAAVIDWLLSPQAHRITGQVLPVDGGFTAIRPLVR
ncbi:SDR family NAD(P)-dependent oxidoreductase [Roseateles sp. BYS87W]|uniref:SDR family NAD(P)-dependent oxidoreductase n=1 Tax=Pelomonas baiyunensis TaxID=3299026 RepID=A0ABW7GZT0_9BURK